MDASGAGGGCPPHVRRRHKLSRGHLRACGSPHSTAGFFADFAAARVVTASGADKTAQVRCPRLNFFRRGRIPFIKRTRLLQKAPWRMYKLQPKPHTHSPDVQITKSTRMNI